MKRCFHTGLVSRKTFKILVRAEVKRFPGQLQWPFMVMNCFKNESLGKTFWTLYFINNRGRGGGKDCYGEGIDIWRVRLS